MQNAQAIFSRILPLLLFSAMAVGCTAEARKNRHLDRAEKYFKAGQYKEAKIEYMNVVRADPQNAKAFQRLGAIWSEQGAPLRAAPFLNRARELAPGDIESRLKLARIFLGLGAFAEARKELLAVLEQSPGNGEAILLLSEASRAAEDIAALEEQLQKFPDRSSVSFHVASATLALRKNDMVAAEEALRRALSADPKSSLAHSAIATLYLFRKERAKAGEELKTAADLAPLRSSERIHYADFQAQTGAQAEAIASLNALTAKAPDYLPAWRLLAQIAFNEKKFDEALVFLEKIFKQDPDNPDSRMLEAQTRVAKGEGAKAVQGLERLEKAYPKAPAVKLQLARAHLSNKDTSAAIEALNEVIAGNQDFVEAILLRAQISLRSGDAPTAINSIEELLKKHPGNLQAEILLAEAYRLAGRLDDAVSIFRTQLTANPNNAPSYAALGVIFRQQKKSGEARAAFEKTLELSPDNAFAADQLVEIDITENAFDAALKRVEHQLERKPDSATAHLSAGKIYAAQKELDKAEAAFSKAVELDPNLSPGYDLLLQTYIAANKLSQAIAYLDSLLQKNPDNPAALMILGFIYDKMADYPKARDAYEKLIAVKPDLVLALNNLAYLYSERLNQLDRAAELARKARNLQPAEPGTADTLGWILYKQGDYQQALGLLQESAAKLPDNPEVQYHVGMASYVMGQTEVARAAFRKAAESPRDFAGKNEIPRRLALLGDASSQPSELSAEQLEALLQEQPNDLVALIRLAEIYEKQGEVNNSAKAYERALKINSRLVQPTVKLAQFNAGPLQNKEKALEFAKKARELAPNDPEITGALGRLAYEAGNFSWAYSLLQESARQLPDNVVVQRDYAWAAYSLGKVTEAQQAMEKIAAVSPESPSGGDARSFLAMLALEANVDSNTLETPEVQELLKKDQNYAPALMVQAAAKLSRGETKAAEEIYAQVLRRFPDFAPAQKELAGVYSADPANTTKAYELAMKARKVLTEDPDLARILGIIYYNKKDYAQAIQAFQQSGRGKPLDSLSLFYLGMSHLNARQRTQAVDALNRALATGLKEPFAEQARKATAEPSS